MAYRHAAYQANGLFNVSNTHAQEQHTIPFEQQQYFEDSYLIMRATKQRTPAKSPILPMAAASCVRLPCRGVSTASVCTRAIVLPHSEFGPTARTMMVPEPSVTCRSQTAKLSLPPVLVHGDRHMHVKEALMEHAACDTGQGSFFHQHYIDRPRFLLLLPDATSQLLPMQCMQKTAIILTVYAFGLIEGQQQTQLEVANLVPMISSGRERGQEADLKIPEYLRTCFAGTLPVLSKSHGGGVLPVCQSGRRHHPPLFSQVRSRPSGRLHPPQGHGTRW